MPRPLKLLAASNTAAWVAFCDGEPSGAKLVLGSGPGEPIDQLLAQDPQGRYVVTSRDGVVELVDAFTLARVDLSELGVDARRARLDYSQHRTLRFDAGGRYLAYVRRSHGGASTPQIVLRTLATGSERIFASGVTDVFRLELSADARYIVFEGLREDTNHNGKLDWPAPEETAAKDACGPGLPRFRSFGYQGRGDALTRRLITVESSSVADTPDLVTPLGQSLLVREADGALRLERGGKRSELLPASCGGRVLFADSDRGLVLATCAPPPPKHPRKGVALAPPSGKREVWLLAAGSAKKLPGELYETSIDRQAQTGIRLVPLYPGAESALVDLERRELLPLPAGSRVVASVGSRALIWREGDLYGFDAESKREEQLARGVQKSPDLFDAGGTVLLTPFVVIGAKGPALPSPPRALAVSAPGFVLTASGTASLGDGAIEGPLRWVDARLAPADGPSR